MKISPNSASSTRLPVLLVKQLQPIQHKVLAVFDAVHAVRQDDRRELTGGDAGRRGVQRLGEAVDHAVEHAGRAKDCAGLHAGDGVRAEHAVRRRAEVDLRQLRGAGAQRLDADAHARQNRAAPQRAGFVQRGDGDGRVHRDDHAGRSGHGKRRDRAAHELAAHLRGVVGADGKAGFQPRAHEIDAACVQPAERAADARQHGRHHAREDHAGKVRRPHTVQRQHRAELRGVFVRALGGVGVHAGTKLPRAVFICANQNIRIADIYRKEHAISPVLSILDFNTGALWGGALYPSALGAAEVLFSPGAATGAGAAGWAVGVTALSARLPLGGGTASRYQHDRDQKTARTL